MIGTPAKTLQFVMPVSNFYYSFITLLYYLLPRLLYPAAVIWLNDSRSPQRDMIILAKDLLHDIGSM